MTIEIKVPAMGESVTEATVARWFKKEGDAVTRDEPLLELETDKVTVEVPAPADGAIESISVKAGDTVQVGALLGAIAEGKAGSRAGDAAPSRDAEAPKPRRARLPQAGARPSRRRKSDAPGHAVGPAHRRGNRHRHRRPSPAPARTAASPRATCWARWKPRAAKPRRAGRRARRPAPQRRRARNACR